MQLSDAGRLPILLTSAAKERIPFDSLRTLAKGLTTQDDDPEMEVHRLSRWHTRKSSDLEENIARFLAYLSPFPCYRLPYTFC